MNKTMLETIAENSDIIVCGYAFTKTNNGFVRIINLNHPDCAIVINMEDELIETNMDPIEQKIVLELFIKNKKFIEE